MHSTFCCIDCSQLMSPNSQLLPLATSFFRVLSSHLQSLTMVLPIPALITSPLHPGTTLPNALHPIFLMSWVFNARYVNAVGPTAMAIWRPQDLVGAWRWYGGMRDMGLFPLLQHLIHDAVLLLYFLGWPYSFPNLATNSTSPPYLL